MSLPFLKMRNTSAMSEWSTTTGTQRSRTRRIDAIVMAAIFLLGFVWYWSGLESQDYHLDESRWINRAGYLTALADPFGPTWNHQYLTRGQPPIGSYSIGLGLVLQGRDLDTNPAYDFRRSRAWNEAYGTFPDHADLMAGRRWNAFLGAVTASVVYLATRKLTNPVGGIVSSVYFLSNPLETWYNRIALADTTLSLTLALLFLTMIVFMRRPAWRLAIVIGVLIGIGGGNKFTPLALSVPLAGIGGLLLLRGWWWRRKHPETGARMFWGLPNLGDMGWMLISTPFVALFTFVASYPYLWPDPINRTLWMLRFRQAEMDNQYRLMPHFQTDSPWQSLQMTYEMLGNTWSSTLQMFKWLRLDSLGEVLSVADIWLAIAGLTVLTIVGMRKGIRSAELAVAALIVFQLATIILNMRVAFERYYLPIMLGQYIAVGAAVGYLVGAINKPSTTPPVSDREPATP